MAMARADDVLTQAGAWLEQGEGVALATVVSTWGSSPRPVGSQLAVNGRGEFVGSVSGGCVEGAVIDSARRVIADGVPALLRFSVTDEQALGVGLTCGGTLQVLIAAADDAALLSRLRDCLSDRAPACLLTDMGGGRMTLLCGDSDVGRTLGLPAAVRNTAQAMLALGQSAILSSCGEELFAHSFVPAPRLIIVGAGHIAQALAPMAEIAGFDVCVVDPRRSFATAARLPGTQLSTLWPDEFFRQTLPDANTALVTLVHDPKIDDPALEAALASEMFYVGALGSRKTHEKRLERLREKGIAERDLACIHAPVGLDLGARKPPEIAVSIVAEVVRAWNSPDPEQ